MDPKTYDKLLNYYQKELSLMDYFHFNSKITESIYKKYIQPEHSTTLSITHSGIKDNRMKKRFDGSCIRLMFVGHITAYKGFPLLKETLLALYDNQIRNWSLEVWGGTQKKDEDCPLIEFKGKYNNQEIKEIYQNIDLLIVPSICKETFSLVTLEAISHGVPVLVSDNVGAKEIVAQYDNYFIYNDPKDLYEKMKDILSDINKLINFNEKILSIPWNHSMESHADNLEELIYKKALQI